MRIDMDMDARSLIDSPIVPTRDGGYALPIVIFALVVLGVIGGAALQSTRDELLSAVAVSSSSKAFYAAEAGLHAAVSSWDQDALDTLLANPGDSLVGPWTTIENRCSYRLVYRRIDGGDTPIKLYSVESMGRSPGSRGRGQRMGVTMRRPLVVSAALSFGGNVTLSGNPTIKGACPDIHSNGDVDVSGTSTVAGNVTSSGTATVGGTLVDTLGNAVSPTSGTPEQLLPDLDSTDYCDEADYIFNDQWGLEVATGTLRNLDAGTYWGWKWSGGTYVTDSDDVAPGVYCMNNDVEVGNQLGTSSTPLSITILTTKSLNIPGDPYITPAHSDGILIIAEGDVKLNGSPSGGEENFEGLVYAGAQCEVSGTPVMHGQLICRDDANPAGSEDWVSDNKISGDLTLTYSCGGLLGPKPASPLGLRMWNREW